MREPTLHDRAMSKVDDAAVADMEGDYSRAETLRLEAYALEREAANAIAPYTDYEPTRSIVMYSAASLGLRCDDYLGAYKLADEALKGKPEELQRSDLERVRAIAEARERVFMAKVRALASQLPLVAAEVPQTTTLAKPALKSQVPAAPRRSSHIELLLVAVVVTISRLLALGAIYWRTKNWHDNFPNQMQREIFLLLFFAVDAFAIYRLSPLLFGLHAKGNDDPPTPPSNPKSLTADQYVPHSR